MQTMGPAADEARAARAGGPRRGLYRALSTVLVVGSTPALGVALAQPCHAFEMVVRTEADAISAAAALRRGEGDIVVIDAAIGNERLVEFLQQLRVGCGVDGVPAMVVGDVPRLRTLLHARACGAVDHVLAYPFDPQELELCLGACRRTVALQRGWRATLDRVSEAVVVADGQGRVHGFNAAAQRLFQIDAADMLGRSITRLMPAPQREAHDRYVTSYLRGGPAQVIGRGRVEQGLRRDGTRFPMLLAVSDISDAGGARFVGVIRDLTPERERDALREQALHDGLTGLPNRAHALVRLQRACADGVDTGDGFALLYVDLDRFKPVNDALGHPAGDTVLVAVVGRLRHGLADRDFVARGGGDEFVVLLGNVGDRRQARAVADRLRRSVARPIVVPGGRVAGDASVGVAIWPDDGLDADALLAAADREMYRMKRARGEGRQAPFGIDD